MKINKKMLSLMIAGSLTLVSCNTSKYEVAYFEKGLETVTMDDILLTTKEKGLTENKYSKQIIQNLNQYLIDSNKPEHYTYESQFIDLLNIDNTYYDAFTSQAVVNEILNHENRTLLTEKGTIDKELMLRTLYDNSITYAKKNNNCEALTKDEVEIITKELLTYIKNKQQDNNIDIKKIACQLQKYSIVYCNDKIEANAMTHPDYMYFFIKKGKYPNFHKATAIIVHELSHLISNPCVDQMKGYSPSSTGIYTNTESSNNYFPFSWSFIEEAEAEIYSKDYLSLEPETYADLIYTFNNLKLALSVNKCFNEKNFEHSYFENNIIAMIQQFPIPNNSSEEWFVANLKMLECYEILTNDQKMAFYATIVEQNTNIKMFENNTYTEEAKYVFISLQQYANLQLKRIFIYNLTLANTNDQKMNLDDYYYLYHLCSKRISMQNDLLYKKLNLKAETNFYLNNMNELTNIFTEYLSKNYKNYSDQNFTNFDLLNSQLSSNYSKKQKYFYHNLKIIYESEFQDNRNIYINTKH